MGIIVEALDITTHHIVSGELNNSCRCHRLEETFSFVDKSTILS
jgi:hypothetical protein